MQSRAVRSWIGTFDRDHKVTVLTRDKAHAESLAGPVCVITGLNQIPDDERFDVVINLAGDPVANRMCIVHREQLLRRGQNGHPAHENHHL